MMAEAPEVSGDAARSRYPGTAPFTDSPEDHARFFGRDDEVEQLYLRVLSVPLLVQFGASGLGKTSLLQAGLFPRLREKYFLPIMVRLNIATETLTNAVMRSLRESLIGGIQYAGDESGLWEIFSSITVWKDDLLYTPVLVFDQFEEVFTLRDAEFRKSLAAELGALANAIPPARLRDAQPNPRRDLKIIISLREDYLGALEEFSKEIPGLFHELLRLDPLVPDEAADSIRKPALLEPGEGGPFASPRFELDQPALDAMIAYLKGKSGIIEAFQLQLLCVHAERIAIAKRGEKEPVRLTLADFQGSAQFSAVLEDFYRKTLVRIPGKTQRKRVQILCEDGLIGSSGHRLMLEEGQIRSEYSVEPETLKTLCRERLLRREARMESAFYEITHDRLAESIFAVRPARLSPRQRQMFWTGAIAALIIMAFLAFFAVRTNEARKNAETLLSFLLGEEFLGEVRDSGRTNLLEQVDQQVHGDVSALAPVNEALALRNRGDIELTKGHVDKAAKHFEDALGILEKQDAEDAGTLREMARTRERLADALAGQGNLSAALQHYGKAIETWNAIATNPEDCVNLANSLTSHAWWLRRTGDADKAFQTYDRAFETASNLLFGRRRPSDRCGPSPDAAEPYPDADILVVLADVALYHAITYDYSEDYAGAAALAQHASFLNPGSTRAKRRASAALIQQVSREDDPLRTLDINRKVLAEGEEFRRRDPDNQLLLREHAASQLLVGEAIVTCQTSDCSPMPLLGDAEALTLDALATFRGLSQLDSTNTSLREDLIWALEDYANVLAAQGQHTERLARLKEAEDIHRSIERQPIDANSDLLLGRVLMDRARALDALQRLPEAIGALNDALAIFRRLVEDHPRNPPFLAWLISAIAYDVELLAKAGDKTAAAEAERAQKVLSERYAKRYDERIDAFNGADAEALRLMVKGSDLHKANDFRGALGNFEAAKMAERDYIRLRPAEFHGYRDLYIADLWIQTTLRQLERNRERAAALIATLNAAQIAVWLAPDADRVEMNTNLLQARYDFGTYLYIENRLPAALATTQEEVAVADGLMHGDPGNLQYQARLGQAKCELGLIRRYLDKAGWKDVVNSGLIHLERAVAADPSNQDFDEKLKTCRGYLE